MKVGGGGQEPMKYRAHIRELGAQEQKLGMSYRC